jgi:hypothetical protein
VSCCISNKKSILLNPHLFDVSIPFVGLWWACCGIQYIKFLVAFLFL